MDETFVFAPALALALLAARGELVTGEAAFRPTRAEFDVPERFRLEPATFPFEMQRLRDTPNYTVWAVRFPSPIITPDRENNTIHAEYFQPRTASRDRPLPGVVVLHILGADFALSRYMAARLADGGVAALFMKLPYYGERRQPGRRFLTGNIQRTLAAMRQGVCDVRRAAAWLADRPEIDPARLGVTGISLGGIVSALAASVDPAIGSAALLLAGGGVADVLWEMPEAAAFRALWIAAGRTREDLRALTRAYDPVTYAHRLHDKRVLMLAGNADEVVPPRAAEALWHAAGQPQLVWFDCGHYSAVGYLLPGMRRTVEFFAAWP